MTGPPRQANARQANFFKPARGSRSGKRGDVRKVHREQSFVNECRGEIQAAAFLSPSTPKQGRAASG